MFTMDDTPNGKGGCTVVKNSFKYKGTHKSKMFWIWTEVLTSIVLRFFNDQTPYL